MEANCWRKCQLSQWACGEQLGFLNRRTRPLGRIPQRGHLSTLTRCTSPLDSPLQHHEGKVTESAALTAARLPHRTEGRPRDGCSGATGSAPSFHVLNENKLTPDCRGLLHGPRLAPGGRLASHICPNQGPTALSILTASQSPAQGDPVKEPRK